MIEAMGKEAIVRQRYAAGAKEGSDKLCCPVDYESDYLQVIPQGSHRVRLRLRRSIALPARRRSSCRSWQRHGENLFHCCANRPPKRKNHRRYMTYEMLEVRRRNAPIVAERIAYANVDFRKGRIQDVALDLELLDGGATTYWVISHNT
jgi:hypothetical protein